MFLLYNIINIHAAITTIVTMQLTLIAALHLYIIKTYLSSVSTQFHNSYPSLFIQYYLDWKRKQRYFTRYKFSTSNTPQLYFYKNQFSFHKQISKSARIIAPSNYFTISRIFHPTVGCPRRGFFFAGCGKRVYARWTSVPTAT